MREVHEGLSARGLDFELLVVENGSIDATREIARQLASKYPNIHVSSRRVANYGAALREGLIGARGELAVTFDVDYYELGFVDQALALLEAGDEAPAIVVASKRVPGSRDERRWPRRRRYGRLRLDPPRRLLAVRFRDARDEDDAAGACRETFAPMSVRVRSIRHRAGHPRGASRAQGRGAARPGRGTSTLTYVDLAARAPDVGRPRRATASRCGGRRARPVIHFAGFGSVQRRPNECIREGAGLIGPAPFGWMKGLDEHPARWSVHVSCRQITFKGANLPTHAVGVRLTGAGPAWCRSLHVRADADSVPPQRPLSDEAARVVARGERSWDVCVDASPKPALQS